MARNQPSGWFFGGGFWSFCWWCIPVSYPAGHDSLFFVLPKKSKQKKGAPEMATPSLNFHNRAETGKTRCAQTVSRHISARLRKFKAPSRAGKSKAKPAEYNGERQSTLIVRCAQRHPRRSRALARDCLLFRCPMRRLEFLLQGGKRKGNYLSAASFSLPLLGECQDFRVQGIFRRIGRAFLCLLSLARQRK